MQWDDAEVLLHRKYLLLWYIGGFECKLHVLGFGLFTRTGKDSFHFVAKQLNTEQGIAAVCEQT